MKFSIYNNEQIKAAITHISQLPLDKRFVVDIYEATAVRSGAQNSLYWLWLTTIADQAEIDGEVFDKETWHYFCGIKYLGVKKFDVKNITHRMPAKSTKSLTIKEFSAYLNNIEADFIAKGVKLPFPDYYGLAMGKE